MPDEFDTPETDGDETPDPPASGGGDESDEVELPGDVVDAAERLTRLARNAVDEDEADAYRERRASVLDDHDFTARVRDEDDTLVLHPEEWVEDGVVRVERVEDTDRAVEISLSGPGDADQYDAVEAHNASLVRDVESEHGAVHAANARAFADFMGNHYVRKVETATRDEIAEFLEEYYPRNAWPSKKQRSVADESLALLFEAADEDLPEL
jgi:hypothetical protein